MNMTKEQMQYLAIGLGLAAVYFWYTKKQLVDALKKPGNTLSAEVTKLVN